MNSIGRTLLILAAIASLGYFCWPKETPAVLHQNAIPITARRSLAEMSDPAEQIAYFTTRTRLAPGAIDLTLLSLLVAFENKDPALVARLFQEWLERDEASALAGLHQMEGFFLIFGIDPPYKLVADHFLTKYSGADIMERVAALPGESMATGQMVKELFRSWHDQNSPQLLTWIQQNPSFTDAHALLGLVEHQLAQHTPTQLSELSQTYLSMDAADPRREMLCHNLLDAWITKDPTTAGDFLNSLSDADYDSPLMVQPLQTFATHAAHRDPAQAMEWATQISHPETRLMTQALIGSQWMESSPAQWNAWKTQLQLTPAELTEFDKTLTYMTEQRLASRSEEGEPAPPR